MKTGLTLLLGILTVGCSPPGASNINPMRNSLVVDYPVEEVWEATKRLIFEKNWTMDVVDDSRWYMTSVMMEMPSYGNSRWWDCGMRPITTLDTESNPTNPRRTSIISVHQVQVFPLGEDSAGVILTMSPKRRGSVLIPCRSRGGYERLFYEQVESTIENLANQDEDSE